MVKNSKKQNCQNSRPIMLRFLGFCLKYLFFVGIWLGIFLVCLVVYYSYDLPDLNKINKENKDGQNIVIYYQDGEKLANIGDLYDEQVVFSQLPYHLVLALIATEDRKFFKHSGVDFLGIARAFVVNLKEGRVAQGGSSITQQLAKILFLENDRKLKRKVQELLLAFQLERRFSKEQIVTLYLNYAYFGAGQYGIKSAAKFYFNKKVENLSLDESAMLVGLLKAPSRYSPTNDILLNQQRTRQVLVNMKDAGYLDNLADDLSLDYQVNLMAQSYIADYIKGQVGDYIGDYDQDLRITTSFDANLQQKIEDAVVDLYGQNQQKLRDVQIGVVAMDYQGRVLGMIGGKDYLKSQFNRAISAKRQSGSAFKSFIYLSALAQGFYLSDEMVDEMVVIGDFTPDNYNYKYYGQVSLMDAFAKSLNSVVVKLYLQLDKKILAQHLAKFGFFDVDIDDPTIVLGSHLVSLMDMVMAYGMVANDGYAILPSAIEQVAQKDGEILYKRYSDLKIRVFDEVAIEQMKIALKEVVDNGTGKAAKVNGRKIYG